MISFNTLHQQSINKLPTGSGTCIEESQTKQYHFFGEKQVERPPQGMQWATFILSYHLPIRALSGS